MAHPLVDLRKLLAPAAASIQGIVIKTEGETILVATAQGTLTVRRAPGDATAYPSGTQVSIREGYVRGKRAEGPVYVV